jgi:hypothetical protein
MMPRYSDASKLDFYWTLILKPFTMTFCRKQLATG